MVDGAERRLPDAAHELDDEVVDAQHDVGVVADRLGSVLLAEVRDGIQEQLRVRVPGRGEQLLGRRLLDDRAAVHHHDAVGHVGDDTHVVGDQDDRGAESVAEIEQQLQDRRLHGDVEGRRRLVGDDDVGVARDRHRDDDALLLAAGQLVRVVVDAVLGVGQADQVEQFDGARPGGLLVHVRVRSQALDDLPADGVDRVERRGGLLEHHRDLVAADRAQLVGGLAEQLVVTKLGRPGDRRRGRQQAEHRP